MRPVLPSSSPLEPFDPFLPDIPNPAPTETFLARPRPILPTAAQVSQTPSRTMQMPGRRPFAAVRHRPAAWSAPVLTTIAPLYGERAAEMRQKRKTRACARSAGPGCMRKLGDACRRDRRGDVTSARALQHLLDRLVGLLGELGIKTAELGNLVQVVVVGALGEARLDLDRLLERLGREQLLDRGRALLERPLGVVGHLGGDGLPALAPLAEHLHGGVDV